MSKQPRYKVCPNCKTEKPIADFCKDSGRKDGLFCYCKSCTSILYRGLRLVQNLEGEIWRPIEGFEKYMISNKGRLKHIYIKGTYEKVVKTYVEKTGYVRYTLVDGSRRLKIAIHREVARNFVPNPCNYETVNHKDFNRQNNNAENLEWMTAMDNIKYSIENERHFKKPIVQMTKDGKVVKEWDSAYQCEKETGFKSTDISRCLLGKSKTYKGFVWKLKEVK